MGTPGYGDYILFCVITFVIGFRLGRRWRSLTRMNRVKKAVRVCAILACLASAAIAFVGVLAIRFGGDLSLNLDGLLTIFTGMALAFIWVMKWIGIPVVIGSVVLKQQVHPTTDQAQALNL